MLSGSVTAPTHIRALCIVKFFCYFQFNFSLFSSTFFCYSSLNVCVLYIYGGVVLSMRLSHVCACGCEKCVRDLLVILYIFDSNVFFSDDFFRLCSVQKISISLFCFCISISAEHHFLLSLR